jgi:hypothetical protein
MGSWSGMIYRDLTVNLSLINGHTGYRAISRFGHFYFCLKLLINTRGQGLNTRSRPQLLATLPVLLARLKQSKRQHLVAGISYRSVATEGPAKLHHNHGTVRSSWCRRQQPHPSTQPFASTPVGVAGGDGKLATWVQCLVTSVILRDEAGPMGV